MAYETSDDALIEAVRRLKSEVASERAMTQQLTRDLEEERRAHGKTRRRMEDLEKYANDMTVTIDSMTQTMRRFIMRTVVTSEGPEEIT